MLALFFVCFCFKNNNKIIILIIIINLVAAVVLVQEVVIFIQRENVALNFEEKFWKATTWKTMMKMGF
jgi:hypothetical protein